MNEATDYKADLGIRHGWARLSSSLLTEDDHTWCSAADSSSVFMLLFVVIRRNDLAQPRLNAAPPDPNVGKVERWETRGENKETSTSAC